MKHHNRHHPIRQPLLARLYFWFAEQTYRDLAWAYDTVTRSMSLGQIAAWRRDALAHVRGPRVLEVGFGTGELLSALARLGLDVYGLERSPEMQRITDRKLRSQRLFVPRVQGVVQRLPFPDGCFDTIVSTFPTGFIFEPAVLAEFARVLQTADRSMHGTGGRLIVVGIGLSATGPLLTYLLRNIFGTSEANLASFHRRAADAGFRVTTLPPSRGWIGMPVIIAERG